MSAEKDQSGLLDEDITKGKDHEALEGPMTRGRLKQAQHVIETRLVICIAAIDDD